MLCPFISILPAPVLFGTGVHILGEALSYYVSSAQSANVVLNQGRG